MSWLYSRALVAEYSAATFSDGERYARSSKTPTPQAFLPPDRMTAFSRPSRYGMTFAHFPADLGEALLTWFRADSRVRTYPLLAEAPASMASDPACGARCDGSLAKYDPASSSWKTAQLSLLAGSEEFSETWPSWGSMRSGECWEQMTWAPRTGESESGLWPTPTVCGNHNRKGVSSKSGDGLATAVKKWPTPVASMSKGSSPASLTRKSGEDRSNDRLDHAVMASDGGPLNPTWVEWLMGWPEGWTDLRPLAMARFHEWQRQHSSCYQAGSNAA